MYRCSGHTRLTSAELHGATSLLLWSQRREEELQREMERQKAEKEQELARLRAQQERAQDKQAERDTLKAKRRQEEFEREWRRKQKEEAEKK